MTAPTTRLRYAVIGNPIEHSRSPFIHEQFARQLGIALDYEKIKAPVDDFAATVGQFFSEGGSGLNVTLPFKEQAAILAPRLGKRARLAGAVNTLWMEQGLLHGCNTDGVGLLNDLRRLGLALQDKKILLVGAGGAAKGIILPLLAAGCARLRIINRTPARALELQAHVVQQRPELAAALSAGGLNDANGQWDLVVNATSSSLGRSPPSLSPDIYAPGALAYDLMYAAEPTSFMQQAQRDGAENTADGLGMLVGQAAESFAIWHGAMPDTEPVLAVLRQQILAARTA
ncbi:MAG: shikimate dehydrogenase [Burkholderiaceae bacterium]